MTIPEGGFPRATGNQRAGEGIGGTDGDLRAHVISASRDPGVAPGQLGFGTALAWLEAGRRVARQGWNGKNMYLELQLPDLNSKMTLPYVYMKTADNHLVPWLCSQTDMLAKDWYVLQAT